MVGWVVVGEAGVGWGREHSMPEEAFWVTGSAFTVWIVGMVSRVPFEPRGLPSGSDCSAGLREPRGVSFSRALACS